MIGFCGIVMAGLDPAIPLGEAKPCHIIGIAGSSPAMTAGRFHFIRTRSKSRPMRSYAISYSGSTQRSSIAAARHSAQAGSAITASM